MTAMMNNLPKASFVSLLPNASRNADATGTIVDVSGYEGEGILLGDFGFVSGTSTLDVKAETSTTDDFSADVEDVPGGAFTQITTASGRQAIQINMNGLKQYLRINHNVGAAGSPVYLASVWLVANKKYGS